MSKIFGMDICPSICSRLSKTLPPMRAHWRHLANTFELVLHSVHPSPKLKWQVDWFSRFCTAHGRKSPHFTMDAPIPQNWPFPCGIRTPSNTIPWAHLTPQAKWHLNQFSRFCTDDWRMSLYLTMGCPFLPQNCPFPWGLVPWAHPSPQP